MFPQPPPFVPCGGFSPTRLEAWCFTQCPSVPHVWHWFSQRLASRICPGVPIPFRGHRLLMRQSDVLPAVYCSLSHGSVLSRAARLTFPSLTCHTLYVHAATPTPPTVRLPLMVHPPALRAFVLPAGTRLFRFVRSLVSERSHFRGGSFVVMLRPARLLGRLDQSPPFACATDRPTRLRRSLPQPGSPQAEVCYHYSAQPPIAEAGFAPARMSRIKGCAQEIGSSTSKYSKMALSMGMGEVLRSGMN